MPKNPVVRVRELHRRRRTRKEAFFQGRLCLRKPHDAIVGASVVNRREAPRIGARQQQSGLERLHRRDRTAGEVVGDTAGG